MIAFCLLVLFATGGLSIGRGVEPLPSLEDRFREPPDSGRMWTWWFWLHENVDRASITKDLEAMKEQGIGGVTVFSLAERGTTNRGPEFLTEEWLSLFKHTLQEAKRLQLGVSAMLCSGWNAGGPWIEPEHAAKRYTITNIIVSGPQNFKSQLPMPAADPRYYEDISVLAFPVLAGRTNISKEFMVALGYKSGQDSFGHYSDTLFSEMCEVPRRPLDPSPDHPVIHRADLMDLTAHCDSTGLLQWNVPEGDWVVLRIGCTLTGSRTIISTPGAGGLEADPLDSGAMDVHFENVGKRLLKASGDLTGKVFKSVQIDSWEIRPLPNWTPKFRDEFIKYRGYDPQPYLPTLGGYLVENADITDRFLYDYRKTLGDCVAENYYGRLTQLARAEGLAQQSEAGGVCYPKVMSMDALKNLGRCDIPMGEFWQNGNFLEHGQNKIGKQTASAAHIYGKTIAAAEAFTSFWHWTDSPESLKPTADRAFCEGINHFFIFSSATRSNDGIPGAQYHAGTHFNRRITWWNHARAFSDYIARCSYLLQKGLFRADVLFYNGDGSPNYVSAKHLPEGLGAGFDYDVCNTEVLLTRVAVKNGKIVLPDGMTYEMLVLPDRVDMPLDVIIKLRELVDAGMTLVGPKPSKDPGLKDYPRSDEEVRRIANQLWGDVDGGKVELRFGKGRTVWGRTPREVLVESNIHPDFSHNGTDPDTFIDWIHRQTDDVDVYFVANRRDRAEQIECMFRVHGKQPEIWDPVDGSTRDAVAYRQTRMGTTVPLRFAPHQSLFIVFRKSIEPGAVARGVNFPVLHQAQELAGPWEVTFDSSLGGPSSAMIFDHLTDWTKRPEEEIRYYSGTATYRKTFRWSPELLDGPDRNRLFLNLGGVKNVAAVRLNGHDLGTVWCAPWQVELTSAVKEKENRLEIDIVNLWPNRLIGDGKLPVEKRITRTNIKVYEQPNNSQHELLESGLLGPVTLSVAESF
jgi:hypothetical protein